MIKIKSYENKITPCALLVIIEYRSSSVCFECLSVFGGRGFIYFREWIHLWFHGVHAPPPPYWRSIIFFFWCHSRYLKSALSSYCSTKASLKFMFPYFIFLFLDLCPSIFPFPSGGILKVIWFLIIDEYFYRSMISCAEGLISHLVFRTKGN